MKDSLGDSAPELFNERSVFCNRTKTLCLYRLHLLRFILQSQKAETNQIKFTFYEKKVISTVDTGLF